MIRTLRLRQMARSRKPEPIARDKSKPAVPPGSPGCRNCRKLVTRKPWQQSKLALLFAVSGCHFLNLDSVKLEQDWLLEGCYVTGIVARGTEFCGTVVWRDCLFAERVQMSARKEEAGYVASQFHQGMQIEDCCFQDTFTLRTSEMEGEFACRRCQMDKAVVFDKTTFQEKVEFVGPGRIALCSFYQSKLLKGLRLEHYTIDGEQCSLDLNKAKINGTLVISDCHLNQALEFKRARVTPEYDNAWEVENSVLANVDIRETQFFGKVQFYQVKCQGNFLADILRQEYGQKVGKATTFHDDAAFIATEFSGQCLFQGARFQKYANFKKCVLYHGGNFNGAEFNQVFSFWESQAHDSLHFRKAHFHGRSQIGKVVLAAKSSFNEAIFEDELLLYDIKVEGDIFFSKACFNSHCNIREVHVNGGLGLQKITVEGDFKITKLTIADRFILSESVINGSLVTSGLSIGTWGSIAHSIIQGNVDLSGLQTGVAIDDGDVPKVEIGDKRRKKEKEEQVVPGTMYVTEAIIHKLVNLAGAKIKGQLCLDKVNMYEEVDASQMIIGHNLDLSRSYFRGVLHFGGLKCRGAIKSYRARYKEEVSFNGARCLEIYLNASSFDRGLTIRKAKVEGQICLHQVDIDGKADLFGCKFSEIFFKDLLVDHFLIDRKMLGEKLPSEQMGDYRQAANEYGILKQAFQLRSQYQDMDWAYYRFCRSQRKSNKFSFRRPLLSLLKFCDWLLLDLGFGYGTRPANIGGVALVIVVLFSAIYFLAPAGGIVDSSGNPAAISYPQATYLSLIAFASMDYGDCVPAFAHWLKYLLAFEGALGIFLITMFVATISRKIIRT